MRGTLINYSKNFIMQKITIRDLENLTGIKAHTLRIWEQRYDLFKPQRTDTNIRYYDSDELKKVLNIALLNKYGYKISHINKMSEVELNDKILSLNLQDAQLERLINELIRYMVEIDTERFESVLDNYIANKGIERAIIHVIFPFLEKIGILWVTNHINPAHEHIISNIIRQKLVLGIEHSHSVVKSMKTALLFLPENEYHELGLLFVSFLLKSRGISVLYLGCSIPISDVEFIVRHKSPDFIYTHVTAPGKRFQINEFIQLLEPLIRTVPTIMTGSALKNFTGKLPKGVQVLTSGTEIMEYIRNL